MVDKKEIPIEWEGKKETVVIRKLKIRETHAIKRQSRKMKNIAGVMHIEADECLYMELVVEKSIMKAPFKFDKVSLLDLYPEVFDPIFEECDRFSKLSESVKKN